MESLLHPISIHRLERDKVYYVSHRGGKPVKGKVIADMHEELPFGGVPGGVMVVFSYQPYSGAAIGEHDVGDHGYRFYSKEGPKAPAPSPRRSSSARRSSARRSAARRAVSRVRRTKSAPRHKQRS
jgi:hypothetical protein